MSKISTKGVQKKAWQCCNNSWLEIVSEIQPEKNWKIVWTCSRRWCWKWRNEDFEECYDSMWQRDQGNEPYIVVVNKNERNCAIADTGIPGDIRVSEKEKEKIERH